MPAPQVGYLTLICTNPAFRGLWLADVVSLFGDWFHTIAVYSIVERLTHSPFALGLVFIIKMGCLGVASPLAGVLADRFDRRRLMIGADLLRFALGLGYFFVHEAADLPLLYALIGLQITVGSVFQPARSASLPNVTRPDELITANALMATTWSTLLALGAGLGGFATEWLGAQTVFAIDAASYLLSAAFLWRIAVPSPHTANPSTVPLHRAAFGQILDGFTYLRRHPPVARVVLAKAAWASGGSALVYLLALIGPGLTGIPEAVGVGLLFSARGLGTGLGPVVSRVLFKDPRRWPALMGLTMLFGGALYATVALDIHALWILLPVFLAHSLSGTNWVFSSILLQLRAEDAFRGRVFATEWWLLTLSNVVAILAISTPLERHLLELPGALLAAALVLSLVGALWLLVVVPAER